MEKNINKQNNQTSKRDELKFNKQNDRTLILYNDDYNTFEHIIDVLEEVCKHSKIQAEQCAHLVHYKGKYIVKKGDIEILQNMLEALISKGLNAIIE